MIVVKGRFDMNEIELVKPSVDYSKQIWDYRAEFISNNDNLAGCAGLEGAESVDEWLANIEMNSCETTVKAGLVPATTFLAVRTVDNQIVGMIDIRHRLNEFLLQSGGHIGYSIRPSERQKGYATEMLRLALIYFRETLVLEKVLITCDKENIASAKTIIANGGRLENELLENNRVTRRYWIVVRKMIHNITKHDYLANPCRSSSVAYWKAISYPMPDGVTVTHEADFFDKDYPSKAGNYFRLIHDLSNLQPPKQEDYLIRTVEPKEEKELVTQILGIDVAKLMTTPVYDSDLWIIAIEIATMKPVGIGIADFDTEINEGSLEWLEVLPEYRRAGIGTLLVNELLQRLKGKADFVTASGEVDNEANVETLYRKCGFVGDNVWYVARKEVD